MTVKELITELSKYPGDIEVFHSDGDVEGFEVGKVYAIKYNGEIKGVELE